MDLFKGQSMGIILFKERTNKFQVPLVSFMEYKGVIKIKVGFLT